MIDKFKEKINQIIETPFEKELADTSIAQLDDINNKLRFNNFAYSLRELSRHILQRLAPDDKVKGALWFYPVDKNNPDMIARTQRMKYAIQKGLSDDYVLDILGIDVDEPIHELKDSIDTLSKYTHVNPETFDCTPAEVDRLVDIVCNAFINFVDCINSSRERLIDDIESSIDQQILSKLFYETIDDIDWLATHYEVEEYTINSIKVKEFENDYFEFEVDGTVSIRLQYGSDGDMKRDDGFELYESYPISALLTTTFENNDLKYNLELEEFQVDTDSHWG